MLGTLLFISLAVGLVGSVAWDKHFRGRSWRDGLDRMLREPEPIIGGSDDFGVTVNGNVIEFFTDPCDICGHRRHDNHPTRGRLWGDIETRCNTMISPKEPCKCSHYTRFGGRDHRVGSRILQSFSLLGWCIFRRPIQTMLTCAITYVTWQFWIAQFFHSFFRQHF
jgi:hypothetical protein